MALYELEVGIKGSAYFDFCRRLHRRGWRGYQAGFLRAEFKCFAARGVGDIVIGADRLPPPPSLFMPLQEVVALGVMLLAAGNPDLVADDPTVFLNHGDQAPLVFDADVFDDVDTFSVLPILGHLHSSERR